jgi:hypothetical protein
MGKTKTAADTESGKYTEAQAEEAGWKIQKVDDARAVKAGITGGGQAEVVVTDERWVAEKTYSDHLISASGHSLEHLLEQLRTQETSLESDSRNLPLALPVVNDNAGDAEGDENVGLAGVLPETAVDREAAAEAQGVRLLEVNP